MDDIEMIYNTERQTWNVFVNGEWYAEGNYEYATEVCGILKMGDAYESDNYDDYYGDNGDEGYNPAEESEV